jgi:hypothetical protein
MSEQISFQFAFFDAGCNNYPAMLLSERTPPLGRIKLPQNRQLGYRESDWIKVFFKYQSFLRNEGLGLG